MEPPAFGVSVLFRKEPEADGDADATGAAVRANDGFYRKAKAEHSGEKEKPEDDWVSAELIGGEIAFEWAGSGWP